MSEQTQKLRERIAALQAERDQLETEARQHEQAARDKRARRDEVKADLAELSQSLAETVTLNNSQEALQRAKLAGQLAEAKAAELDATKRRYEELLAQLEEKLQAK